MTTVNASPSAPAAEARPQPEARCPNMIAIASGKGGVGKTWLAITLAHTFARAGERVLLFDGDLGLANVDIQLGLMPKHDLGAVIAGRLSLAQAASAYTEGGFDIIAGRSGSGRLANIPSSRLRMLGDDLTGLATSYDHIILDLGAGVERTVRQLAHAAGACVVVTTDEPTSLTDAYAFIKVTHMEQPGTDFRIIVNMANSTREGERTYNTLLKACQGFLKISPPLLGVVRRDKRVRDAIRNQTSLLVRSPNTEAASDVETVARGLAS
ncbi:MAG: MinD/ParA family protein [Rhodobacterales bacterium]|nr:MinD/ParA family protein [Rhodobacterales bacterium]